MSTSSLHAAVSSQSIDSDQSGGGGDVGAGQLLTPQASPRGDAGKVLGVSPIPEETSDPQQQQPHQLQQRSQQQLVVSTNASNQSLVRSEPSKQKGTMYKTATSKCVMLSSHQSINLEVYQKDVSEIKFLKHQMQFSNSSQW